MTNEKIIFTHQETKLKNYKIHVKSYKDVIATTLIKNKNPSN